MVREAISQTCNLTEVKLIIPEGINESSIYSSSDSFVYQGEV